MSSEARALYARAVEQARMIGSSPDYVRFVDFVRRVQPDLFDIPPAVLDRDYLRVVDHHLRTLIPYLLPHTAASIRRVHDFGCGSGGSAIALAMTWPWVTCVGTDVDGDSLDVARERARLYGVADRCEFVHVPAGGRLPLSDGSFDFSLCSSVLEYVTASGARQWCVHEIARVVKSGGLLFFSVPNGLYPIEIHTRKWGWNHFPVLLNASIVDTTCCEIRRLARPNVLTLHRTPLIRLFKPWSAFCLRKEEMRPPDVLRFLP